MSRNPAAEPSHCLPPIAGAPAGAPPTAPIGTDLPACEWRGPIARLPQFPCRHPQVHAADHLVDAEVCSHCRHRNLSTQPGHCFHPGQANAPPKNWEWAVGITTAPRRISTLASCLKSVREAGWDALRLFAEPGTDLPELQPSTSVTWRDQRLGAFPNWYLGLSELAMRHPTADAYFMIQDDAVFSSGLRKYLEQNLWPAPTVGVISVYCPSHYARNRRPGLHCLDVGVHAWGALGYIFPNEAVRCLLSSPHWLEHRQFGPAAGLQNIDTVVGLWCQQLGRDYFVHVPSLAQHIGETSTLYPQAVAAGRRCASDFVPDIASLVAFPVRKQPATTRQKEEFP